MSKDNKKPPQYHVTHITKIDKEGNVERERQGWDVDDIEKFRLQIMGDKYVYVSFIYEQKDE